VRWRSKQEILVGRGAEKRWMQKLSR
jgi:hypothetical protein